MITALFALACASSPTDTSGDTSADTGDTADTGTDTADVLAAELVDARADWDACGLESYTFVLQYQCFCPAEMTGPATITVEAGAVVSATYVGNGEPVDESFTIRDVPALFGLVGDAIGRPADQITVTWDATCGYPTAAYFDYEIDADDEELGFTVTALGGG